MKKKDIVSKLGNIISEGTKKGVIKENEEHSSYPAGMTHEFAMELMELDEASFLEEIMTNGNSLDEQRGLIQHRIEHLKGYPTHAGDDRAEERTFAAMGEGMNELSGEIKPVVNPMEVLKHYFMAALWTEEEQLGDVSVKDLSNKAKLDSLKDIEEFINKAGMLLNDMESSQIGHDLWLTRNGHGAGFWDRGLGEIGDKLTEIAKGLGEKNLYKGDDGKLYID